MPVGRRRDVDDVDVGPGQDLAEIAVSVDAGTADLQGPGQVLAVDIANGPEDRAGIAEMDPSHAADADDGLGQGVARGDIAWAAEDAAGTMTSEAMAAAPVLIKSRREILRW